MRRLKTNSLGSRILSGFLSLTMILSACPIAAYAEDSEPVVQTIEVDPNQIVNDDSDLTINIVDANAEEDKDDNLSAIPEDEDAEDQVDLDVETPPKEEQEEPTIIVNTNPEEDKVPVVEEDEPVIEEPTKEDGEIVFDHYFSKIDEKLVNTTNLLVQTSDKSVFTKNTNITSNYDDVYIISCETIGEARYTYSYYVDKVDNITDMSNVMSIASNEVTDNPTDNEDVDPIANLSDIKIETYEGYIALIDTGANGADVNLSVIGDDGKDNQGHGTEMLEQIKKVNPDAKVLSIKAFDGSTTNAADVYAAIKLAIKSKVKVINLSFVGSNVEKNKIVADVIQEAIDNDIIVIGAAGNYNSDSHYFIPGCIDKVITVGAANKWDYRQPFSNYNADFYVVADSTSAAAARYTGLYTLTGSTLEIVTIYTNDTIKNYTQDDKLSHINEEK